MTSPILILILVSAARTMADVSPTTVGNLQIRSIEPLYASLRNRRGQASVKASHPLPGLRHLQLRLILREQVSTNYAHHVSAMGVEA